MSLISDFFNSANDEIAKTSGEATFTMNTSEKHAVKITIESDGAKPEVINVNDGYAVYAREGENLRVIAGGDIIFYLNVYAAVKKTIENAQDGAMKRMLADMLGGGRR